MKSLSQLEFKNEGTAAEISIYGVIDGNEISAKTIKQTLDAGGFDRITVRINSVGGDVQEGIAIGNIIKSYGVPTTAVIDSLCASIATVVADSCDHIVMASNASFMIHLPSVNALPDPMTADDLRAVANSLDSIYKSIKQTYLNRGLKINEAKLDELMAAETWLTATEALEMGFIDEVSDPVKATACATRQMLNVYKHAPKNLLVEEDEPGEPKQPEPKEGDDLNDLLNQLFDVVDKIKQKTQTEPDPQQDPKAPEEPATQQRLENIFKGFLIAANNNEGAK